MILEPTLLRIFGLLRCLLVIIDEHTKSADLAVDYSPNEAFALPIESNKTTGNLRRYDKPPCSRYSKAGYNCHTHRHLLLTLILTLYSKVAKFRLAKHKASINAIHYV